MVMAGEHEPNVMTAHGLRPANSLGITLTHEHLLVDLRVYGAEARNQRQKDLLGRPVTMDALGELRRAPGLLEDNLVLDDAEMLADELKDFRAAGGETVVEVSPLGIRGDLHKVVEVAQRADVNLVLGSGYYIEPTHPPDVSDLTVDDLTAKMVRAACEGFDDTPIRPGVIGEIGISQPPTENEWKVLTAACEAQKETGLPLMIHPYFGENSRVAPRIVQYVLSMGVAPTRVNICHMDGFMNIDYQRRVADMGVFISFDTFGLEVYYDGFSFNHNTHDSQREKHIVMLTELGYIDQLLISQDVCMKFQLKSFGGYGYSHILDHIVPSLSHKGLSDNQINGLLVDNPRRFLSLSGKM